MKRLFTLSLAFLALSSFIYPEKTNRSAKKTVIVWQPSHQTDTGKDFSEALTCNAIAEAAMKQKPKLNEHKVWSLNQPNLHHANVGSNTIVEHTAAVIDGKLSGYAYEINKANELNADVFIALHNNGGTNQHAIWGFIHEGDPYESENKELASRLVNAVSKATDLTNKGVLFDSWTGRNDYVCKNTGKKAFYSLDENVNKAKYRVLLEIGDMGISKTFLENPENQKKIGQAIKIELAKWLEEKGLK